MQFTENAQAGVAPCKETPPDSPTEEVPPFIVTKHVLNNALKIISAFFMTKTRNELVDIIETNWHCAPDDVLPSDIQPRVLDKNPTDNEPLHATTMVADRPRAAIAEWPRNLLVNLATMSIAFQDHHEDAVKMMENAVKTRQATETIAFRHVREAMGADIERSLKQMLEEDK